MFEFGAYTGAWPPKRSREKGSRGEAGKARISLDETIIYELNVRGFSKLNDEIPEDYAAASPPSRNPGRSRI